MTMPASERAIVAELLRLAAGRLSFPRSPEDVALIVRLAQAADLLDQSPVTEVVYGPA